MFLSQYVFKSKSKRLLAALADALGSVLFFIPALLKRPLDPSRIKKILVIRLDHLGDIAMTRPALAALRQRFPHTQIDLLVSKEAAALFLDSREVRNVLTLDSSWFSGASLRKQWAGAKTVVTRLRTERYDLGIDFRGDLRNILLLALGGIPERFGYGITGGAFLLTHQGKYFRKEHQVTLNLNLLQPLGIESKGENGPFVYSGKRKLQFWNSSGALLPDDPNPRILLHAGAGYPSKRWRGEKYESLIKKILEENFGTVILIGTEAEKNFLTVEHGNSRIVDLRGRTKLDELPVLFDACHLFIGNDSGPSHIAAAQGLPLVILFSGTNDPSVWHPWSPSLTLVRHEVPCSPCEARECPLVHHDCMEKITVDEVLEKVRQNLENSGARRG